jgi:hypothetical protein
MKVQDAITQDEITRDKCVSLAKALAAKAAARRAELVVGFRSGELGSKGLFITRRGELITQDRESYAFVTPAESVRFYRSLFDLMRPAEAGDMTHSDGLEQWLDLVADAIEEEK